MTHLPADSWSTSQLVAFLALISEQPDEAGALRAAVERVLETLDAEVGVLFNRQGVTTAIGLAVDDPQVRTLIATAQDGAGPVQIDRLGECRTTIVALDPQDDALRLLVARAGAEDFIP